MRNKIIITALCLSMAGCASWKYPNWEYVRIENEAPTSGCVYKMQESCDQSASECPKWYKLRATKFNANTVVMPNNEKLNASQIQITNNIGNVAPRPASIAEYYYCNGPKNIKPQ